MKQCSKCGEFKEISQFCKRTVSKDGYGILCKECRILINTLNKDKRKKLWKQYYEKKKKIICAKRIIYKLKNNNKIKEIKHKSYLKNKEKIKQRNKDKKQNKPIELPRNRSLSISEYLNS